MDLLLGCKGSLMDGQGARGAPRGSQGTSQGLHKASKTTLKDFGKPFEALLDALIDLGGWGGALPPTPPWRSRLWRKRL